MQTMTTSVTAWVFAEYEQRIRAGKSGAEAAQEVKALVEEFGRVEDLWREKGEVLLHHVFADGIRAKRGEEANREPAAWPALGSISSPLLPPSSSPLAVFGDRRVDLAPLRKTASIFDALVYVGTRYMRYGDMKCEDWRMKGRDFALSAANATTRRCACDEIGARLVSDKTTEECLTEEEFKRLIPAIGF